MKSCIIAVSIIVLMWVGLASPQQDNKQGGVIGGVIGGVPGPSYLYVHARALLANRAKYAMPEYPPSAIDGKIQGDVALSVRIDKQGNVVKVEPRQGSPILAIAATKAVSSWKYKPFALKPNDEGVASLIFLTFDLEGSPSVRDAGPSETVDRLEESLLQPMPKRTVNFEGSKLEEHLLEEHLIHKVDPDYPAMAKIAHVQGKVIVDVVIDKTGNVASAKVLTGHPLLADAALKAIQQWKYAPFVVDNNPVEVDSTVTVTFHM